MIFFNDFFYGRFFRNQNFQHVKILFLTNVSEYRVLSSIDLKTVVPTCFEPQLSNKRTFIIFFVIENNYENPDLQKRIDRKNRRRFFQQQKKSEFRNAWVSLTFPNIFFEEKKWSRKYRFFRRTFFSFPIPIHKNPKIYIFHWLFHRFFRNCFRLEKYFPTFSTTSLGCWSIRVLRCKLSVGWWTMRTPRTSRPLDYKITVRIWLFIGRFIAFADGLKTTTHKCRMD